MSSTVRKVLSQDAPIIIHELRTAFELNEPALKEQAVRQQNDVHGAIPEQIQVRFHFDQFQVYAVYQVREAVFSKLLAYAQEEGESSRPTFLITVFLSS